MKDGLALLLDKLAGFGIRWLRFLYAYPNKITGRLLETIARHDNICKYLDMPSAACLRGGVKSMRRGANADIFLKTIEGYALPCRELRFGPHSSSAFRAKMKRILRPSQILSAPPDSTGLASSVIPMKKAPGHFTGE